MSDPVFVAFATQKGGVGKSTLTALVAAHLYYLDGMEVMAIDCDDRQHSLNDYREKDLLVTEENPILKRAMYNFYKRFGKPPYEIIMSSPADAVGVAMERLDEGVTPKVVFFDITGTINDREIVKLLSVMDYLFVPITLDTADMKSSLRFANHIVNRMMTTGQTKIKEIRLLWNKIPSKSKPYLCELIEKSFEDMGIYSLSTVMGNSARYSKDGAESGKVSMFRSTMMPPDKQLLKGSNLPELVNEIREIIKV